MKKKSLLSPLNEITFSPPESSDLCTFHGYVKATRFRRPPLLIEGRVNVLQKHLLLICQQVNWFWKHHRTKPTSANTPFHLVGQVTFYKKQYTICWTRELFPQFQFIRCTYLGALVRSLLRTTNFRTASLIPRQTVIMLL